MMFNVLCFSNHHILFTSFKKRCLPSFFFYHLFILIVIPKLQFNFAANLIVMYLIIQLEIKTRCSFEIHFSHCFLIINQITIFSTFLLIAIKLNANISSTTTLLALNSVPKSSVHSRIELRKITDLSPIKKKYRL